MRFIGPDDFWEIRADFLSDFPTNWIIEQQRCMESHQLTVQDIEGNSINLSVKLFVAEENFDVFGGVQFEFEKGNRFQVQASLIPHHIHLGLYRLTLFPSNLEKLIRNVEITLAERGLMTLASHDWRVEVIRWAGLVARVEG